GPLVRLAYPVAREELRENLGARARVVADVPLQLADVEEAAPHASVHLHEADVARAREEIRDASFALDELSPAALLPGRGGDEMVKRLPESGLDLVRVRGPLARGRQ